MTEQTDKDISAQINAFWEIEHVDIKKTQAAADSKVAVLDHYRQTIKYNDGRYKASLPWNENSQQLIENNETDERRLASQTTRLRNHQLMTEYDACFQDYIEKGYAEAVEKEDRTVRRSTKSISQSDRRQPRTMARHAGGKMFFKVHGRRRNLCNLDNALRCAGRSRWNRRGLVALAVALVALALLWYLCIACKIDRSSENWVALASPRHRMYSHWAEGTASGLWTCSPL